MIRNFVDTPEGPRKSVLGLQVGSRASCMRSESRQTSRLANSRGVIEGLGECDDGSAGRGDDIYSTTEFRFVRGRAQHWLDASE
jgi:hypothetical protein